MAADVFEIGIPYEQLARTTLGPDVEGTIGPEPDDPGIETTAALIRPEHFALPTTYYWCVDGRLATQGYVRAPRGYAHPQIAAGLGGTSIGSYYMIERQPQARSEVTGQVVDELVADGYEVIFHGDDHAGLAGCKANVDTRESLRHNAEHVDDVTELTIMFNSMMGIREHMRDRQVRDSIMRGGEAADNDRLWNITGAEAVEIASSRGARYELRPGKHFEKGALVTIGTKAFDRDTFAEQHPDYENNQLFSFDLGALRDTQIARGRYHNRQQDDTLAIISSGTAFNIGVARHITREGMPIYVWGPQQEQAVQQGYQQTAIAGQLAEFK